MRPWVDLPASCHDSRVNEFSRVIKPFEMALTFSASDIPSQSGKIILITGGNAGIGFEVCVFEFVQFLTRDVFNG